MGTRGLTVVISGGATRVAQYGQWDHYPSGQGITALTFCREHLATPAQRVLFAVQVAACTLEPDDIDVKYNNDYKAFLIDYPASSRDVGAEILALIQSGPQALHLKPNFAEDDLFCEGVFTVNLDTAKFTTDCNYAGKATFDLNDLPTDADYLAALQEPEE